ncbi:Rho GTPase-activating protein 45 [Chionoecetes opilio]|uniref:Rho GTPase-activating protein 45 n=1 Tax=Chionoecetes opilio TaxID=41210 RepID=A0A8J5CP46_CHIOP|nr:Rho GTPase-activating protein 45 [Chionoecetes opilio]
MAEGWLGGTSTHFSSSSTHLLILPQFQTLCESSRLYEPGSQYMEFVKRLGPSPGPEQPETPFAFQSYRPGAPTVSAPHDPAANGSVPSHDDLHVWFDTGTCSSLIRKLACCDLLGHNVLAGSPTDLSLMLPPPCRSHTMSSGDELETDPDTGKGGRNTALYD